MKKIFHWFKKSSNNSATRDYSHLNDSYFFDLTNPSWSEPGYQKYAGEGYQKNVVANRCISLIAKSAASVDWLLYKDKAKTELIPSHPLLDLLHKPNLITAGAEFFEAVFSNKLISGNAYILAIRNGAGEVIELQNLRPDLVAPKIGKKNTPLGYTYKVSDKKYYFPVDQVTGYSDILHLKNYNPLNPYEGMSAIEPAAYSIDLHNQSSAWNQSLLQNSARPSGALVLKRSDGSVGNLNQTQFERLRDELSECFTGKARAGRPMLLEGGLEWQEMGFSPKDMDFIEAKNSAARDIALAFGVPPHLLGIKGDNTYNNMQEARLAFWEDTILPLLDKTIDAINLWLTPLFSSHIHLSYNKTEISALSFKQDSLWERVSKADFLSDDEKRTILGLGPKATSA